jgi:hypothetical protein
MTELKPDSERIRQFLRGLEQQDWVKRGERRWWPRYVFHYTDIKNTIEILKAGQMLSRKHLEEAGGLLTSSGSTSILAGTDTFIKDCVRLYFRPRTPTQYWAEGIRSKESLRNSKYPDAHCPLPIFLLLDSAEVLTRADCWFSDGGLNSYTAQRLYTAVELENLPWQKVYHNTWYDPHSAAESDIAFRRNAEVVVHKRLDLKALRSIFCRSEAERETLLYLLPQRLRKKYQNKIFSTARVNLYFREHTFIQSVRLSSNSATFFFSPDTKSSGPFSLRAHVQIEPSKTVLQAEIENFELPKSFGTRWDFPSPVSEYNLSLTLDGHQAYTNRFIEEDEIPF